MTKRKKTKKTKKSKRSASVVFEDRQLQPGEHVWHCRVKEGYRVKGGQSETDLVAESWYLARQRAIVLLGVECSAIEVVLKEQGEHVERHRNT